MFSEKGFTINENDKAKQVARAGVIAELEAISEYEDMLDTLGNDPRTKAVISDIILDEKEHMGMFFQLLLEKDNRSKEKLQSGMQLAEKLESEVF